MNKNVKKVAATVMAVGMVASASVIPAFAASTSDDSSISISPRTRFIDNRDFVGSKLDLTYNLHGGDGPYINFYVKNYASSPVTLTINGMASRTIPGNGGYGHIYVVGPDYNQNYTFKAVPQSGSCDIHYEITQRDQLVP